MEQDNAEDSDFDGEVSLNDTNNLKVCTLKVTQINLFGGQFVSC